MVDLYLDDMTLESIQVKNEQNILLFRNREKDETLAIPVSKEELVNIYQRAKIRCEILELIKRT